MTDLPKSNHHSELFTNEKLNYLIEIVSVHFFERNNWAELFSIESLPQKALPTLLEKKYAWLQVDTRITHWGQKMLAEQLETLVTCQGQVFVKPLSPITNQKVWRSVTSTTLTSNQEKYSLVFEPAKLEQGIYSLQLLLLTSGIRSSPILFELPAIQVK